MTTEEREEKKRKKIKSNLILQNLANTGVHNLDNTQPFFFFWARFPGIYPIIDYTKKNRTLSYLSSRVVVSASREFVAVFQIVRDKGLCHKKREGYSHLSVNFDWSRARADFPPRDSLVGPGACIRAVKLL